MADIQAVSYADVVPGSRAARGSIRWSRVLPLMLLVPIVVAFGTPVFAFALLAAVLLAPLLVAGLAAIAARQDG